MNNNKIKIGIAGLGTVGSGVINLLEKNKVEILKRSGFEISIVCVSASNKDKKRARDVYIDINDPYKNPTPTPNSFLEKYATSDLVWFKTTHK